MEFARYTYSVSETLSDRLVRLTSGLNDTQVGEMMGTTADAARKLRIGEIRSIKLENALRLCRRLGISPWYLAGEVEPLDATPQGNDRSEPAAVTTLELAREVQQLREDVHLLLSDRQGRPAATETPTKRRKPS